MKRLFCLWVIAALFTFQFPAHAAALGTATADFENAKPDKGETAWGRLVADALRAEAHADIALVNAGALKRGTLKAGAVDSANVDALLTFGDDDIVTITLTGAQLRAGLERAVQSYPDGSVAFLQGSGFSATFNPGAPVNRRLTQVRAKGHDVDNKETFKVALPVSLAEGSAGYFTIWKGTDAQRTGSTLRKTVTDHIRGQKEITPSGDARLSPK